MSRPKTISFRDARREAHFTSAEMSDAADANELYENSEFVSDRLDRDKFYAWLEKHQNARAKEEAEEAEDRYQSWLQEHGEFLRRFIAEEKP